MFNVRRTQQEYLDSDNAYKPKSWFYDKYGNKVMKYAYYSINIIFPNNEKYSKHFIRPVASYNHIRGFLYGYLKALSDIGIDIKDVKVSIELNTNDNFANEVMPAQNILNEIIDSI